MSDADGFHFRSRPEDEYYFEEGCFILEYLNDPADPHASIARARVPPGVATRRHRLPGTTERYFILSGEGRVTLGEQPAFRVRPGDTVLIPPGTAQSISNDAADDLVFLAICTPRFRPEDYRDDPA
ncbi:MAG: cupin domain-containing protein [Pseudomonadales bacterium]